MAESSSKPDIDKVAVSALPESLVIGVPPIDQEHQGLFDHLEVLKQSYGEVFDLSDFADSLSRLSSQLIDHFASEEKFMRAIGVPATELARHVDAHNQVIEQITELSFDLMERKRISRDQILGKVGGWIVEHLTDYDLELRQYRDS